MKKILLALFAAGVIFAGCQKPAEEAPVAPEVTPTTEAPAVSTDTVATPAPEAK